MSIANLAQAARQSLARGLEALQARDAPPALIDVAQPVARAIGELVDIELSPDIASLARVEPVLDALRDGLRLLQVPEHVNHPAAARGMKAVAEAMSTVLMIVRSLRQGPPPPPPAMPMRPPAISLAPAAAGAEPALIPRAANAVMAHASTSIHIETSPLRAEPVRAEPEPVRAEPEPVRAEPEPVRAEPEATPAARGPRPATPEPLSIVAPPSPRVVDVRAAALSVSSRPAVAVRRDVVLERDLRAVEAPLGAHSPSNFYTGLAGGDVVASGGLFVATYRVPKIGERVLLKISLPGGYEFVAKALVAWTRDVATSLNPSSARGMAGAPGFGAQFCEITEEGRRLIQRYVRNREPLFHEDGA
jgi:Tfp pilus assembly protein PilZ